VSESGARPARGSSTPADRRTAACRSRRVAAAGAAHSGWDRRPPAPPGAARARQPARARGRGPAHPTTAGTRPTYRGTRPTDGSGRRRSTGTAPVGRRDGASPTIRPAGSRSVRGRCAPRAAGSEASTARRPRNAVDPDERRSGRCEPPRPTRAQVGRTSARARLDPGSRSPPTRSPLLREPRTRRTGDRDERSRSRSGTRCPGWDACAPGCGPRPAAGRSAGRPGRPEGGRAPLRASAAPARGRATAPGRRPGPPDPAPA
jgi:hypothetical protein